MRKTLFVFILPLLSFYVFGNDVQVTKLDNNIDLILYRNNISPLVNIGIIFDVGYLDTPIGKHEVIDLISENIVSKDFLKSINAFGISCNIRPQDEFTEIFAEMLATNMRFYLEKICERISHFSLEPIEYLKRKIMISEKLSHYNFHGVLHKTILAGLKIKCKNTRLMFNENELSSISENEVLRFYNRLYMNSNIIVIIAGDIDLEKARLIVCKTIGKLNNRKNIRRNICENESKAQHIISSKFLGSSLGFVYKIPSNVKIADVALEVLSYEIWKTLIIRNKIISNFCTCDLLIKSGNLKQILLYPRIETSLTRLKQIYSVVIDKLKNNKNMSSSFSETLKQLRYSRSFRNNDIHEMYEFIKRNAIRNMSLDDYVGVEQSDIVVNRLTNFFINILDENQIIEIVTRNSTEN